jgi:DMSO/TMAO reductase YedYZ molybdopterin-dependent catalytic subunit
LPAFVTLGDIAVTEESLSLEIDGLVSHPRTYDYSGLAALPGQVPDVSVLAPDRDGAAVRLDAIVADAKPAADARYITLFAEGDYSASVPLDAVIDQAVVIYGLDGSPLPGDRGGPLRFFIPDVAACQTADVDSCANVKYVRKIVLSAEPGIDSRPKNVAQHLRIHRD